MNNLQNRYLKYTPEISEALFRKIIWGLIETGFKPLFGFNFNTSWEVFKEAGIFVIGEKEFTVYLRAKNIKNKTSITLNEILEREPEFKRGDWVVFLDNEAKGTHYHNRVWNKPFILQIDRVNDNNFEFFSERNSKIMGQPGFIGCSNLTKFFRQATNEETHMAMPRLCDLGPVYSQINLDDFLPEESLKARLKETEGHSKIFDPSFSKQDKTETATGKFIKYKPVVEIIADFEKKLMNPNPAILKTKEIEVPDNKKQYKLDLTLKK